MNKDKISVVINTYNAEEHLAQVLESAKTFDEIVICDMESSDHTLDIARQFGCSIVTFERRDYNIVEPARDFAIHAASFDWVLVVDADEVIPQALHDYLYQHIAQPHPADGIYIPRRNYFMGRFMHALYPDYILRFFRKSVTQWPPIIHVQPKVSGTVIRAPKDQGIAFEHLANDTVSSRLHKTDIYTDNEVQKKSGKHYGTLAILTRPTHRFIKNYFLKGGCRDGFPGFVYACLEAMYQVVMLAKLREKRS